MTILSDDMDYHQQLAEMRAVWDDAAATFDHEPDHGLRDPVVRAAWTTLLKQLLPPAPRTVLDIGCGTGSLSLILAELGHHVTGTDLSPAMIAAARRKASAAGQSIPFHIMDAAFPSFAARQFEAVICRHLLWALPQPVDVLRRWVALLTPGGSLHLIEGYWSTGAGLHAEDVVKLLPDTITGVEIQSLSEQAALWGGPVSDERYVICGRRNG